MDHRYLAAFDGSEQAEGRGSGREVEKKKKSPLAEIPYMNMTFAPMERRLDTAIFRALFASSAKQARQFVVHGHVKVNGKRMPYPGYMLNPGDMFQVDPDSVLMATGSPKNAAERRATRVFRRKVKKANKPAEGEAMPSEETESTPTPIEVASKPESAEAVEAARKTHKVNLRSLLDQAKAILKNEKDAPRAKQKQDLRAFSADVRKAIGKINRKSADEFDDEFSALLSQLNIATPASSSSSNIPQQPSTPPFPQIPEPRGQVMSPNDMKALRAAMREARDNPIDASKPYATPWRPRDYMSAFAFIPRYLEVNQNICSAVYLRHPVARPGLAEVPSPFSFETGQLAYNWYLRRR